MLTLIVNLVVAIVLFTFATKLYILYKKTPDHFTLYFLWAVALNAVGQFLFISLLALGLINNSAQLLFLSDLIGRLFLYLGATFTIQISLYTFWPKSKLRFLLSYLILIVGIGMTAYGLLNSYSPILTSSNTINWNAPTIINAVMGATLMMAWLPVSIIFISKFIRSKFSSIKSLCIGLGFLLAALSGIFQDYSRSVFFYAFINLTLALGFFIVFLGFFIEEKRP